MAVDASALVCYITRFTEENFACLIGVIFIYKAIENVILIGADFPMNTSGGKPDCSCIPPAGDPLSPEAIHDWAQYDRKSCVVSNEISCAGLLELNRDRYFSFSTERSPVWTATSPSTSRTSS